MIVTVAPVVTVAAVVVVAVAAVVMLAAGGSGYDGAAVAAVGLAAAE